MDEKIKGIPGRDICQCVPCVHNRTTIIAHAAARQLLDEMVRDMVISSAATSEMLDDHE